MDAANPAPAKQSLAIAVPTAVLVVAATAVGLRFYSRYALVKKVGADDWAVAVAYVGAWFPLCSPLGYRLRYVPVLTKCRSQILTVACGIATGISKFNCVML